MTVGTVETGGKDRQKGCQQKSRDGGERSERTTNIGNKRVLAEEGRSQRRECIGSQV